MNSATCLGLCSEKGGSVYRYGMITSYANASHTCLCATDLGNLDFVNDEICSIRHNIGIEILNKWILLEKRFYYSDNLSVVSNASKCSIECETNSEICGGEGGFMSVYGGNEMIPGAPSKLSFDVTMNPMVSMVYRIIDFNNIQRLWYRLQSKIILEIMKYTFRTIH